MLQFMGSQRVGHDGATELNRTSEHIVGWKGPRFFFLPPKCDESI